ncbi:hypothetical protein [Microcoleus sp. LEGE 07076]|uniref:hypothetical protein n=1 Tax=Microcoleus sp. LEGE 07076 TaxID=915322 RepID=UPI001D14FFB7|nr:hypothetical protein [Microcoleus sp. LEGE 07076]
MSAKIEDFPVRDRILRFLNSGIKLFASAKLHPDRQQCNWFARSDLGFHKNLRTQVRTIEPRNDS